MIRKVEDKVKGFDAVDGAGVRLVRVLGESTLKRFDPFLMLDAFDSSDPSDYMAGFPMHPHRGIETFTFFSRGTMVHEDHLGTRAVIHDGEAQWLTAGSGAFHSEMPEESERMLGLQLWLNMPAADKMTAPPYYHGVLRDEIQEIEFDGGRLRLLAGDYKEYHGIQGKYLPLDYYDIFIEAGSGLTIDVPGNDKSVMVFTLEGDAEVCGEKIDAKTAVKLGDGDEVIINALDKPIEICYMCSRKLGEPIAWNGPIVMNTRDELIQAYEDLQNDEFIRQTASYENG